LKKEKRSKKERRGWPDGNGHSGGKTKNVFPPLLAKPFGFRTVPTGLAVINQQPTKPDTSLATKTGHFHLLPTDALWVVDTSLSVE
jgi:hypothetical protein